MNGVHHLIHVLSFKVIDFKLRSLINFFFFKISSTHEELCLSFLMSNDHFERFSEIQTPALTFPMVPNFSQIGSPNNFKWLPNLKLQ